MKLDITKEWFEKRAAAEGDHEIGAGGNRKTMTLNLTDAEIEELQQLLLNGKPDYEKMAKVWHHTVETMCVLIGINGNGSPEEILAELQAKLATPDAKLKLGGGNPSKLALKVDHDARRTAPAKPRIDGERDAHQVGLDAYANVGERAQIPGRNRPGTVGGGPGSLDLEGLPSPSRLRPSVVEPAQTHLNLDDIGKQFVRDAIRSAYDQGYNDARTPLNLPRDNALGYRGRDKSDEIAVDVLARLGRLPSPKLSMPEPDGWICEDELTLEITQYEDWIKAGLEVQPFWFSPPAEPHVQGEPTAWLVKIYSNDGMLIDTRLEFVKPTIRSTAKTEFVALFPDANSHTDEPHTCPICEKPFAADDICATDITEGTCHAECLAGSPVVNLDTGEPLPESELSTFRYGDDEPATAPETQTLGQEDCAALIDQMLSEPAYRDDPKTRLSLTIAARAIRRGRHLTAAEKLANLKSFLAEDGNDA